MAKQRKKKRTHIGANQAVTPGAANGHANIKDPKTMVIRMGAGEVGSSISQLAADVRHVMEPGTASRLRERRNNRLRDFVTMCGPLGVTHLLLFSRSAAGNTNLRIAVAPRGPTFHFRVEKYSLTKDVQRAQRHPRSRGKAYQSPPLLVMNNFTRPNSDARSKVPRHLESLTTTAFQSLFPPINPSTTPLKSIRRVLLLNRESAGEPNDEKGTLVLHLRHYAITTKVVGVSRPLRRLEAAEHFLDKTGKTLPNLSRLNDIAEYLVGGDDGQGFLTDTTSGSEPDTDAEVEVVRSATRRVLSQKARVAAATAAAEARRDQDKEEDEDASMANGKGVSTPTPQTAPRSAASVEKRAVKLVELGPRLRLRMTKVEEGLCGGKVLWHEYIRKTAAEARATERRWERRRLEKARRRRQQRQNVARKEKEKEGAEEGGRGVDMVRNGDLSEGYVNQAMEEAAQWEEIAGG